MSDLHDLRAPIPESRPTPSASTAEAVKVPLGVFAMGALALGFAVVTIPPKFSSVQRTAALPAFKEVKERSDASAAAPAPVVEAPPIKADYADKSPEEVARLADAVCTQRV